MVIVLLASGFEELEAITPVDILRRNNIDVRTVSVTTEKLITGTHGIQIAADLIASDVPLDSIDMLVLPGGMPGVKNLNATPVTKMFIDATLRNGGRLAAICAAPSIFGKHGMLTNIKATCFPGFENDLINAIVTNERVVTDKVFTTARDFSCATEFANELVRLSDEMGIKPHDENENIEESDEANNILEKFFYSLDEELIFEDSDESEDDDESEELDFDFDFTKYIPVTDPDELIKELAEEEAEEENLDFTPIITSDDTSIADELNETANIINETLASFRVSAKVTEIHKGPRVSRFVIVPKRGVKANSVTNLYNDIAISLCREGIRMEAPMPGKAAIAIEVPNRNPEIVRYNDIIESEEYKSAANTVVPIGMDVMGTPVFYDVAKFPHALVCGATGMGKSVFMNTVLTSLISKSNPDELKLILIDPKKVEFTAYANIPHLLTPIITESIEAAAALRYAVEEMDRRYGLLESLKVRNIDMYNEKVKEASESGKPLPKIVIVIDELADLMMQVRDPIEDLIMRIAQKARASGIYLIVGTQRPSVNVVTGVIKANMPSRVSFKVCSVIDSRNILDMSGAEKLLNRGDMLFHPVNRSTPIRLQGVFISDDEVCTLMDAIRLEEPVYDSEILEKIKGFAESIKNSRRSTRAYGMFEDENEDGGYLNDAQFLEAVELAIKSGKISTSFLQRKLSIGYGKAAKYIDAMEDIGIVSEPNGQKPRMVLLSMEEWKEKYERIKLN